MDKLQVLVQQQAGIIDFSNFESIKQQLSDTMAQYENVVFTEDSKTIAKGELSELRKLSKAVNDRKIEVKNAFMLPYTNFESKVKELSELINKPIELIDKQVKAFDQKQKAEKKEAITKVYNECIGDMAEYLPLQKIYDQKWENVATTIKSIRATISNAVESTRSAVEAIKAMNSDAVDKALEKYKVSLSLTDAITYINNYEAQRQEIVRKEAERKQQEDERARLAEMERVRAEERKRVEAEERIREETRQEVAREAIPVAVVQEKAIEPPVEIVAEPTVFDSLPFETPSTVTARYRVVALPRELDELETLMNSIGICFEKEVLN